MFPAVHRRLLLYTPAQLADGRPPVDRAGIEIVAAPATTLAGRGRAVCMELFDEAAHMLGAGANRSASEVLDSALPALATFGHDALIWQGSSPWTREGRFYEDWITSLTVDPTTLEPIAGEHATFMLHAPSWELYRDAELTRDGQILRRPGGLALPATAPPLITPTSPLLVREKKLREENYYTEFESQWAAVLAAWLRARDVDAMFDPIGDRVLRIQPSGQLGTEYHAHGDPSTVRANFGWAIAHKEILPDGRPHVFFDVLHYWDPADFGNHAIDYDHVESEICDYMRRFGLLDITFDQFHSLGTIQRLTRFARSTNLTRRPFIYERTATPKVLETEAEDFHSALTAGLVHAPAHALAEAELKALVRNHGRIDHPTRGPVQSKDIADCIIALTCRLLGDDLHGLGGFPLTGMDLPGSGRPEPNPYAEVFSEFGRARRISGQANPRMR